MFDISVFDISCHQQLTVDKNPCIVIHSRKHICFSSKESAPTFYLSLKLNCYKMEIVPKTYDREEYIETVYEHYKFTRIYRSMEIIAEIELF